MENDSKNKNREYINTLRAEEYKKLGDKSIEVKKYIQEAKNEVNNQTIRNGR